MQRVRSCFWHLNVLVLVIAIGAAAVAQDKPCDPTRGNCTQEENPAAIAGPDTSLVHPSASAAVPMTVAASAPYRPLRPGEKFRIFVHHTVAPATFLGAGWDALIGQGTGSHPDYGGGMEGFGKRYGASLAGSESSVFFSEFLLPTFLHEDPRYFRRGHGGIWDRMVYASSRVVVTRKDNGSWGFNTSHVLGVSLSVGLSNAYVPESERGLGRNFGRIGNTLLSDAGFNVLREFWPDIVRKLRSHSARAGRVAGEVQP